RRDLLDRVRRHPLMRAVRAGKLTYAALEATLALWARAPSRVQIHVARTLTTPLAELDARARALAGRLGGLTRLRSRILDGDSTTGGGSAPRSKTRTPPGAPPA